MYKIIAIAVIDVIGDFKYLARTLLLPFKSKKHLAIIFISFLLMLAFSFLMPRLLLPSNTLQLQLSRLTFIDGLIRLSFAFLFGLSIGLYSYSSSLIKSNKNLIQTTGTGFTSIIGALFTGKLCAVCIGTALSFLGISGSTAAFLTSHDKEIIFISFLIMIASLLFSASKVSKICKDCEVKRGP